MLSFKFAKFFGKGIIGLLYMLPFAKNFILKSVLSKYFLCKYICNQVVNAAAKPKLSPKYGAQLFYTRHIDPGAIMLDLGCSTADLTYLLAEKASTVDAVDISRDAIGYAKKYNHRPNINYIISDVVSFVSQCKRHYDITLLGGVLSFIDDPESFLREVSRITDIILLRETKFDNEVLALVANDLGIKKSPWKEFTKSEVLELLKKSGYEVIEDFDTYDIFIKAVALKK